MLYGTVAYTLKDGRKASVGSLFLVVILSSVVGSILSENFLADAID
jgi:hypothetical protein